jgi:DUF971 family protein
MSAHPEPRAVDLLSPERLRIEWKDDAVTEFAARQLRLACPCAVCVEEGTGRKILNDDSVPQDIGLIEVELVGRYALCFEWTDHHRTGIFSWIYLRSLSSDG